MKKLVILFSTVSIFATELKIANYNVENLFDMTKSGTEYAQYSPSYEGWNIASYQTKLENSSDVIIELNPDIVALEEIENEQILNSLKNRCNAKGSLFKFAAFGENHKSSGVGIGILSRYPVTGIVRHPVVLGKENKTRNILEVQADTPAGKLRIIAVHWPSKLHKESFRVIAAKATKAIIDTLPKNCEYLILGDFNANYDEAISFLSDSLDNTNGVTGINHILNTSGSPIGTPFSLLSANEVATRGKGFHYDPWGEKRGTDQFSYRYKGAFNTLDHILLPATLLDGKNLTYKANSFSNFTLHGSLVENFTPIRWQTIKTKEKIIQLNKGWSDHLPVSLILTTEGTKPTKNTATTSGSFESSFDGWSVLSSKFLAVRTSDQAVDGKYSLKVSGIDKSNGTMLRLTAIIPPNLKSATLQIAGDGEYGIRICKLSEKKWYYLNGTILTGSASKSYQSLPKEKWVQRIIPLDPFNCDTVNLEIRYRGNVKQEIFIDACNLNGWFRLRGK